MNQTRIQAQSLPSHISNAGTATRGKRLLRGLVAACIALTLLFIVGNSAADGEASGGLSSVITATLNNSLRQVGFRFQFTNHVVRKMAHFTEYAVLEFLMAAEAFLFPNIPFKRRAAALISCSVLVPLLDETVQRFVDGRNSSVLDMLIDYGGMIAGYICAIIVCRLYRVVRYSKR